MPSQQLLRALGEALGSGALVQEMLALSGGGSENVFNVTDPAYGALGDGSANDTAAIQSAVNAAVAAGDGAVVEIPLGIYLVGQSTTAGNGAIEVGSLAVAANIIIKGEGTLTLAAGSAADAVLQLDGNYITVEGIRIDGNESGVPTGRGEGLRINGSYNTARGVYAFNTTDDSGAGATFFINSAAVGTLIESCISFESGEAGVSNRGDFTVIRDFRAIEHQGHAFGTGGGDKEQLTVDGWYSTSSVTDKSGFLIDQGIDATDIEIGYILNHANLSNIIVDCGNNTNYGNGVKFARVRNLNIDKMQVIHPTNDFHSCRIAEGVANVRISNSHLSVDIVMDDGAYDITGSISAAANNGSGFARFTSGSHVLKTGDVIIITGTTSYNGVHHVTASTDPGTTFDTDWKYVADETGTFAIGMETFSLENSTIGEIGTSESPFDSIDNLRAYRMEFKRCSFQNFSECGIDLPDPAKFPVAGYLSIDVDDCTFVGNSASSMFAIRSETTAFSEPNVIRWRRNKLRSIAAGTLFVTNTSTVPYVNRELGLKKALLAGNTTLTSDQSGTLFMVTAADLVITLPPVSSAATGGAGLIYTFVLTAAGLSAGTGLSLSPNSSDKFMGNGFTPLDDKDAILSGGGDREGDSITIVSDGVDGWYITAVTGTWTRE